MEKIPTNEIVNFIFNLIFTNENNKISEQMENCLLNFDFEEDKNEDELYIFKNSKTLKQFVALIHACYIIHLHLCIIGPTGVGKISSTKKISELIQNKKKIQIQIIKIKIMKYFVLIKVQNQKIFMGH